MKTLVLGMHRSGTSALAGALSWFGLNFGRDSDLYPADQHNQAGYFELRRVVELNEQILLEWTTASLPNLWDYLTNEESQALNRSAWIFGAGASANAKNTSDSLRTRIHSYADTFLRDNQFEIDAIKDPRLSLTLPIWREPLGDNLVIVVIRNPEAVARSLMVRDQMPPPLAHELWRIYTMSALESRERVPGFIVHYEDLLSRPKDTLTELRTFLLNHGYDIPASRVDAAVGHVYQREAKDLRNEPQIKNAQSAVIYQSLRDLRGETADKVQIDPTPGLADENLWLLGLPYVLRRHQEERERVIVDLCARNNLLHGKLDELYGRFRRIENHPVSGAVIKCLRALKRDESFGAPTHIDY